MAALLKGGPADSIKYETMEVDNIEIEGGGESNQEIFSFRSPVRAVWVAGGIRFCKEGRGGVGGPFAFPFDRVEPFLFPL